MKKFALNVALVALLVGAAGFSTPSRAETGQVAVVFTKGGFIVGVGGGEGARSGPAVPLRLGLEAFNCKMPMASSCSSAAQRSALKCRLQWAG